MKVMFDLVNVVGLIFEILIINNFFKIISKEKESLKRWIIITSLGLIIAQIFVIIFVRQQIFVTAALVVSMFILSIFYEMNLFARILSSVGLLAFFMIGEMLTGLILSLIYKIPVEEASNYIIFYLQGVILSKLFMIIIMKIYTFLRTPAKARPSGILFLVMMTQPIATCLSIYVMSIYMYDESNKTRIMLTVLVSVLLVIANIIMFYLMEYQMNENEERNMRQLLNQQIEYKAEYYKELSDSQRVSNKTMHDLKNQLFALKSAFGENNQAGMDKLNELCENILKDKPLTYTGKEAIDALISAKYQQMKAHNINFRHSIFMIENDSVNMFDLCIVLGNLLDNAIEANDKIDDGKKEINMEMRQNGEYLYIKITNPLNGDVNIENGRIKTTKKDALIHGFGLKTTEEISNKYNGSITYKHENGYFMVIVVLTNM